ncbi:hypothetical protein AAMO2058_000117100 [Amorphochlora amoebiformis]
MVPIYRYNGLRDSLSVYSKLRLPVAVLALALTLTLTLSSLPRTLSSSLITPRVTGPSVTPMTPISPGGSGIAAAHPIVPPQALSPEVVSTGFATSMDPSYTPVSPWDILSSIKPSPPPADSKGKRGGDPKASSDKVIAETTEIQPPAVARCGKRGYKCHVCGKTASQLGNILRHYSTHTGERTHKCEKCGAAFAQLATLTKHSASIHGDGTKPYTCIVDGCNASFALSQNLKAHLRTHPGRRPFGCPFCPKTFSRKASLCRHQAMGCYSCPHCTLRFSSKGGLKEHIAGHSPESRSGIRRGKGSGRKSLKTPTATLGSTDESVSSSTRTRRLLANLHHKSDSPQRAFSPQREDIGIYNTVH